jgi:hypothetical protein
MSNWLAKAATFAVGVGVITAQAQAQEENACVSERQASAFMSYVLPDVLASVGKVCAASLPASALLRDGLAPMVAKYRVIGDAAWPDAKSVVTQIMGKSVKGVDPEILKPLVATMMAPAITEKLKPSDCGRINHILSLLAPLPPENTAELVALLYDLGTHGARSAPFKICPAAQ